MEKSKNISDFEQTRILPSEFMRKRRPECFSDSGQKVGYILDRKLLEYTLESLTSRNEHQAFELFCRKLCQRTICPNLRPSTGPEGGGDGKVDTETYPISDDIATLSYVGKVLKTGERWAFAFSAKAKWREKIKNDVKNISETTRDYTRIICISSRFIPSKSRLELEDELEKEYGIPITIHDRSWIIEKVIDEQRIDLAYNYLNVGEQTENILFGESDYKRAEQIKEIEASIVDPEIFKGIEQQLVTEALIAAKLSRNMEEPRHVTEGRFDRAVRLAEIYGTYYQLLRVKYEYIWTEFWWFDDFDFLMRSYDEFSELALKSENTQDLELLGNVLQLFINGLALGFLTKEQARLESRQEPLVLALRRIENNHERPNAALEAKLLLLLIDLSITMLAGKPDQPTAALNGLEAIIDEANGLSEFNFDKLSDIVEVIGFAAKNDKAYTKIVEKLASAASVRQGEVTSGKMLLRRAKQLDFDENFEMIRLFGKAARIFAKKEHADSRIEALQHLALAYKSAGLFWAARASCLFAVSSIIIDDEDISQLRADIIPTLKIWAYISLYLRHLPDLLLILELISGVVQKLPLNEESITKLQDDIAQIDMALAGIIAALDVDALPMLNKIAATLDRHGLHISRISLLYKFGHENYLRLEKSIPLDEPPEDTLKIFQRLASSSYEQFPHNPFILNEKKWPVVYKTSVMGLEVFISVPAKEEFVLTAEMLLASFESFFATACKHNIAAYTESIHIRLFEVDKKGKPKFEIDVDYMTGILHLPLGWRPCDFRNAEDARTLQIDACAQILAAAFAGTDLKATVESLFLDDLVADRLAMILQVSNSYHRVTGRFFSRINDFISESDQVYEVMTLRPKISPEDEKRKHNDQLVSKPIKSHLDIGVRSVINLSLWDNARWCATLFGWSPPNPTITPPTLGFCFKNIDAGRKIFEGWRTRFGNVDENEEVYIAIIRNFSSTKPNHYKVMVSSSINKKTMKDVSKKFIIPSRINVMTPDTSYNFDQFFANLQKSKGTYFIAPATMNNGQPELCFELAIRKMALSIVDANDIGPHDLESVALQDRLEN